VNQRDIIKIADQFYNSRICGAKVEPFPEELRLVDTRDVNLVIEEVTSRLLRNNIEEIAGWKIGFLYKPRQEPVICPIFKSKLFESPASIPISMAPSLRIEPEISFRLKNDLPKRERLYTPQEVSQSLLASASLEIIDTRFDTSRRSIREMIDNPLTKLEALADHNTCGAFVTSKGCDNWQNLDFASMIMKMSSPKGIIVQSNGGHAFLDPFLPCVVLANVMRKKCGLKKDDVLVTGSFSGFYQVESGSEITAEFLGLGQAKATFVQ
jgi:2-keto-4-pentenoate hydratase